MARFRFTQRALEELKTDLSREWVYDEQVPLLALMVTSAGAKSYYAVKTWQGKRRFVRIGAFSEIPLPLARKRASEVILQITSGDYVPKRVQEAVASVFTLGMAYAEYQTFLQHHRKASTITQYDWIWKHHLEEWGADRALEEIRRREVVALHQTVGKQNGHYLANRVVSLLRAVINRAIRDHEMDLPNPANAITFYREEKRARRLMAEELPAFFKAVEEEPNRDIRDFVMVSLFTGARKSNVLAMRWSDISLERGLWVIPAAQSKTSKALDVVLGSFVIELLQARRGLSESDFVFPGRFGRSNDHMMDPKFGWDRICKRAGLENLHLHDLRRSLASFQIDTGSPLEVIQKTLGHESKVTTEIYARLALEPVRESVERAAEEMLRRGKGTEQQV
jgi:integrase